MIWFNSAFLLTLFLASLFGFAEDLNDKDPLTRLSKANALFREGNYLAAELQLRPLLDTEENGLKPYQDLQCLGLYADMMLASRLVGSAEEYTRKQRQLMSEKRIESAHMLREIELRHASILEANGDRDGAVEKLRSILKHWPTTHGDPLSEADVVQQLRRLGMQSSKEIQKARVAALWTIKQIQSQNLTRRNLVRATRAAKAGFFDEGQAREAIKLVTGLLAWPELSNEIRISLLRELADCYRMTAQPQLQLEALQKCSELLDPKEDMASIFARAGVESEIASLGHVDSQAADKALLGSIKLYEQCLAAEVAPLSANDSQTHLSGSHLMEVASQLLQIRMGASDWVGSLQTAEKLVALYDELLLPQDRRRFDSRSVLGAMYIKAGRFGDAVGPLEGAAKFFEERGLHRDMVDPLTNLGDSYRRLGKMRLAESSLRQAISLSRFGVLAPLEEAEARSALGSVVASYGRYREAIAEYGKVDSICAELGWAKDGSPDSRQTRAVLSVVKLNRGLLHKLLGNFIDAETDLRDALAKRREIEECRSPELLPYYLALASAKVLDVGQARGERDEVSSWLKTARAIAEASNYEGQFLADLYHLTALRQYTIAAQSQDPQRHFEAARRDWQLALEVAGRYQLAVAEVRALNYLAVLELRLAHLHRQTPALRRHLNEAMLLSEQAVAQQTNVSAHPTLRYSVLFNRGQIVWQSAEMLANANVTPTTVAQRRTEAIARLEEAIGLIELPRAMMIGDEAARAMFFYRFSQAFDLLVDWHCELGNYTDALIVSEMRRNRTFLDQLQIAGVELRDKQLMSEESEIVRRYRELRSKLRGETFLSHEAVMAPEQVENREELLGSLQQVQAAYRELLARIRANSPLYEKIRVESVKSFRQQALGAIAELAGEDNAVLIYHIGEKRGHVFFAAKGIPIQHYSLDIEPTAGGCQAALQFRVTQSVNRCADSEARFSVEKDLRELGDLLIPQQVVEQLEGGSKKFLTIVPDGPLHRLPFEILLLDSGKYFDELLPIHYAPSALVLQAVSSQARDADGMSLFTSSPKYENDPLEFSARESDAVIKAFSPIARSVRAASGSEGAFRSGLLPPPDFVHIAAHALIKHQGDALSAEIRFEPPETQLVSPPDDAKLELHEIHRLRLVGCRLAILSACQTSVGPQARFESSSSLARGFMAAGAQRVVCSHWSVNDRSTAELITVFAQELASALDRVRRSGRHSPDYAAALRRARAWVRSHRSEEWSHPYHWGAFVLLGNATP